MMSTPPASRLPFAYRIRRSARATRVRITVSPGTVQVVAPPDVAEQALHRFVERKQQWIVATLRRLNAQVEQVRSPAPEVYADGVEIPYQGNAYRLTIRPSRLHRIKVRFDDGFIVDMPETLDTDAHHEAIRDALTRWFHAEAKRQAAHYVERHAPKQGLYPRSLTIKTQKSRWGSCGKHNDIHLNWLLILAPAEVFEYVVVHELCHIRERNHSSRFWRLVGEHLPDYQQRRNWLKQQGAGLMMGL